MTKTNPNAGKNPVARDMKQRSNKFADRRARRSKDAKKSWKNQEW